LTLTLGPNEPLIGAQDARQRLDTPALCLDLDALERNIAAMAAHARDAGVALRPHAKTHKSVTIAKMQVAAGAVGVSCATLGTAEIMVRGGLPGVLVTSPQVTPSKLARVAALNAIAERGLLIVVDHPENAAALDEAARQSGRALEVLVDVNAGQDRTGCADADAALALARLVDDSAHLRFRGVQHYSGQLQHVTPEHERQRLALSQLDFLAALLDRLREAGLAAEIVSGAGTGTFDIDPRARLFTELQTGSYVFMDVEYNLVHILEERKTPFETTLFMRNTVVSANAGGFVTIDGGFKCFATDGPVPELASGAPAGARYDYFGDEHGRIVFANGHDQLPIGSGVEIVTPHCDPTVNLHDWYHVVRGDTLVDIWPIDGRGVL
jgi:D-serine deaminase-like pyridoxal phosphate-dependent protein